MKKIFAYIFIAMWFVLILITMNKLLSGNRIVYYVVTIPLLVIPTEIIKRLVIYKKKDSY